MEKLEYTHIDETVYTETLDNGLEVFLLPRKELSKTYSLFTTDYGSIDHTFVPIGKDEKVTVPEGVAHFLEHKLFEKEDRDVFADFGKQGASANAFTSFTETAYLFSATENVDANLKTLLDFVQDPYFTDETVEREKGIIVQELQMYLDQSDRRLFMSCVQAMFKNHHVRNEVLGTEESINAITKEDLYTSYNTFYHPENMILIMAGNFDVDHIMNLIRENQDSKDFAKLEEIQRFSPEEPVEVGQKERTLVMPVSTTKCAVGIKEYGSALPKEEILLREMLQTMIIEYYFGGSGEFYQELYDTGLIDRTYFIDTSVEADHGYSIIGGNVEDSEAFVKKVKELLLSTNDRKITQEALDRMKKKLIGQTLRAMNSLEYTTGEVVRFHRFGLDFMDFIPAVQALTLEETNNFLKTWVSEERLAVSKIVPEA